MSYSHQRNPSQYSIVLLGQTGVGKSSFFSQLRNNEFFEDMKPSKTCTMLTVVEDKCPVKIYDTPGFADYRNQVIPLYRQANAFLLLYDITNRESFEDLQYWLDQIKAHAQQQHILPMVIGNKTDLDDIRVVQAQEGSQFANKNSLLYVEVSCRNALNVREAFRTILTCLSRASVLESRTINHRTQQVSSNSNLQNLLSETDPKLLGNDLGMLGILLTAAKSMDPIFDDRYYLGLLPRLSDEKDLKFYAIFLYQKVVPSLRIPFENMIDHQFAWDVNETWVTYFKRLYKLLSFRKAQLLHGAIKTISLAGTEERLMKMVQEFSPPVWNNTEQALCAVLSTARLYDLEAQTEMIKLDSNHAPFVLYLLEMVIPDLNVELDDLLSTQFLEESNRNWGSYFRNLYQRFSDFERQVLLASIKIISECASISKKRTMDIPSDSIGAVKVRAVPSIQHTQSFQHNEGKSIHWRLEVEDLQRKLALNGEKLRKFEAETVKANNLVQELKEQLCSLRETADEQSKVITTLRDVNSLLASRHVRLANDSLFEASLSHMIVDGYFRSSGTSGEQLCQLKIALDEGENRARLARELRVLRHLYTMSRGSSSQYIINCLHRDLISSSENSASSSLPILTSDLSSPNLLSCPFSFSGLVLEYGGQNLCQFLDKNAISLSFHSRYQILKEIISAVQFLHYHHIVHLNLKPENIVSFASPKEGISRWKLVDFEISCDLSLNPSILLAHSDKFLFSPEYTAPELIKLMNVSDYTSPSEPLLIPIDYQMDIWSIGMISVFLLRGCTVWSMLFPQRSFTLSMIQEWDDVNLEKLKLFFAPKEQLFIESCLKLTDRSSCTDLLSQDLLTNKEIIRSWNPVNVNPKIVNDLASLITEICQSEDKLTEDMRVQLSGLCLSLQSSQSNP